MLTALAQLSPHTLKVTDLEKRRPDGVKSSGPAVLHTLKVTDLEKRRPDGVKSFGPAVPLYFIGH